MKKISVLAASVSLAVTAANAAAGAPSQLPESASAQKFLVKKEVEQREHAAVADVDILGVGKAKARFKGGIATVNYEFRDPNVRCPVAQQAECKKRFLDNPLGFTVLSYEAKRN